MAVKTSSTVPDKQIVNEKDLTNHLLQTFSYSNRVESYDISTASKSNPDAVTSLKLRKQGLTEIPSDLSKFKNLVELDLSDNEIGDFSSKLIGLPNLEVLNLSGNNLTTIPADLCELKKLKTINLSSNKISSGSFSCLTSLERVFLNNNELTSLPAGITEMQSLKSLYLHFNKLTDLDEKLIQLKNLEVLLVQFNNIAETQTAFEHTGILNYVFNPQVVNNRYLYKSFNLNGATSYYKEFDEVKFNPNGYSSNGSVLEIENPESNKKLTRWNKIGGYFAVRAESGLGYHKAIKEEDLKKIDFSNMYVGAQAEVGVGLSAIGGYFSYSEVQAAKLNGGDYYRSITKTGLYYRQYFTDLSKRFRPYAKAGVGVNIFENTEYYKRINLQARVGFDFYLLTFFGVSFETGLGAGNIASIGTIFRLNSRKKQTPSQQG